MSESRFRDSLRCAGLLSSSDVCIGSIEPPPTNSKRTLDVIFEKDFFLTAEHSNLSRGDNNHENNSLCARRSIAFDASGL